MNYAIIAAGEGSRLASEGVKAPKPLVRLNGECLIDRLIRIFGQNQAKAIHVIVNDLNPEVKKHLEQLKSPVPLNIVVKTTPSSMHSFYELMPYLKNDPFCLTTVDTVFDETEFSAYINTFRSKANIDGLMAVTDFVDDEKPLYISCTPDHKIINFEDVKTKNSQCVSGGIYCLYPQIFSTLQKCIDQGKSRMRNFQRELIADGLTLEAFEFSKILDIDHASDIEKAEQFLKNCNHER